MTAKEYLRSVRKDESRYISRCEMLRDMAGYGCGKNEAERISGSSNRSRVEDCICQLVDLERETHSNIKGCDTDRRAEAIELIRQVQRELYRETLFLFYIENLSWEQVAKTIGRSAKQTRSIHGWALIVFENIFQKSATSTLTGQAKRA